MPEEDLESRVRVLVARWRKEVAYLRGLKGAGRDGQQDEYEWKKAADDIEQRAEALEDLL